ncbi:hypothetical protein AeMF1_000830 [Aphanomyces euteiches]|nr:hypothetical protein AeMF1_000830 [Aphanomyces euteiches]KAH9194583.1 hypothetical protein AeNC1_003443 [Aphanomyces euteiches]
MGGKTRDEAMPGSHRTPPNSDGTSANVPTSRRNRRSLFGGKDDDSARDNQQRHSMIGSIPSAPPSKGGGLFGFFKKKPKEQYFPPISPRSYAIYADRRPMEFTMMNTNNTELVSNDSRQQRFDDDDPKTDESADRVALGRNPTTAPSPRDARQNRSMSVPANAVVQSTSSYPVGQTLDDLQEDNEQKLESTTSDANVAKPSLQAYLEKYGGGKFENSSAKEKESELKSSPAPAGERTEQSPTIGDHSMEDWPRVVLYTGPAIIEQRQDVVSPQGYAADIKEPSSNEYPSEYPIESKSGYGRVSTSEPASSASAFQQMLNDEQPENIKSNIRSGNIAQEDLQLPPQITHFSTTKQQNLSSSMEEINLPEPEYKVSHIDEPESHNEQVETAYFESPVGRQFLSSYEQLPQNEELSSRTDFEQTPSQMDSANDGYQQPIQQSPSKFQLDKQDSSLESNMQLFLTPYSALGNSQTTLDPHDTVDEADQSVHQSLRREFVPPPATLIHGSFDIDSENDSESNDELPPTIVVKSTTSVKAVEKVSLRSMGDKAFYSPESSEKESDFIHQSSSGVFRHPYHALERLDEVQHKLSANVLQNNIPRTIGETAVEEDDKFDGENSLPFAEYSAKNAGRGLADSDDDNDEYNGMDTLSSTHAVRSFQLGQPMTKTSVLPSSDRRDYEELAQQPVFQDSFSRRSAAPAYDSDDEDLDNTTRAVKSFRHSGQQSAPYQSRGENENLPGNFVNAHQPPRSNQDSLRGSPARHYPGWEVVEVRQNTYQYAQNDGVRLAPVSQRTNSSRDGSEDLRNYGGRMSYTPPRPSARNESLPQRSTPPPRHDGGRMMNTPPHQYTPNDGQGPFQPYRNDAARNVNPIPNRSPSREVENYGRNMVQQPYQPSRNDGGRMNTPPRPFPPKESSIDLRLGSEQPYGLSRSRGASIDSSSARSDVRKMKTPPRPVSSQEAYANLVLGSEQPRGLPRNRDASMGSSSKPQPSWFDDRNMRGRPPQSYEPPRSDGGRISRSPMHPYHGREIDENARFGTYQYQHLKDSNPRSQYPAAQDRRPAMYAPPSVQPKFPPFGNVDDEEDDFQNIDNTTHAVKSFRQTRHSGGSNTNSLHDIRRNEVNIQRGQQLPQRRVFASQSEDGYQRRTDQPSPTPYLRKNERFDRNVPISNRPLRTPDYARNNGSHSIPQGRGPSVDGSFYSTTYYDSVMRSSAFNQDPHIRGTYMEHTSNIPSPIEALYDGAQDDSDTDNTPHARNYDNDETDESQDQGLTLEQLRLHDQQSRAYRQEPYNERDSYFGGRNISRPPSEGHASRQSFGPRVQEAPVVMELTSEALREHNARTSIHGAMVRDSIGGSSQFPRQQQSYPVRDSFQNGNVELGSRQSFRDSRQMNDISSPNDSNLRAEGNALECKVDSLYNENMVDAANVLNEEVGQLDAAQLSDNRGDALSDSTGSPANTIVLGSVHETTKPPASQRKSGAQQGRPKLAPPGNPPQSNWYPMPRLANVDEKDKMCTEFTILFNRIASEKKMSKETLEIRAAFPEYKLEISDWMLAKKRTQQDDLVTIQCVARLPMDLLVSDSTETTGKSATKQNSLAGFLLKRGEVNVTMQRRYMILADNELVYYKENPELNKGWFGKEKPRGSLHMGNVSLIRPYLDSLTLELVTNKRTWVLQAESEREYKAWARALCHCVPYEAVDVVFRRMFQLAEVDASNVNEVRLATLPSFTVQETVDHILINYLQMAGALPLKPHRPEDFFLKVTGYRDYMVNPSSPVSRYSHVQECLFTKKTLCLTLVHRDAISDSIHDAALLSERLAKSFLKPQESNQKVELENAVASGLYKRPLTFAIQEVRHIRPQDNTHIVVTAELIYAGRRLEKIADTAEVLLIAQKKGTSGKWTNPRWYSTGLNICALPRETRLVFTIFGFQTTQTNKWTQLATTGISIFNSDGLLNQGEQILPLLDTNRSSCHSGPLPQILLANASYLIITLASPRLTMKFDWTSYQGSEYQPDISLDRHGWLYERAAASISAPWTEKWCQINHATFSFSIASDSKSGTLQSFSLEGATVVTSDSTSAKSTSTMRRDLKTWVFTVHLQRSQRAFVFAARTRQERESWIQTIQLVAAMTNDLDDEAHSVKDAPEPGQDKHASYLNKFVKPVGVAQASDLGDFEYLVQLIQENPLFNLTGYEKVILWRHRRAFLGSFEALPRILSCVNWLDPEQVNEIVSILPAWTTPRHPVAYIALLDLTDAHVRQFAVEQLSKLTDSAFRQFLPQLVQALKSETYHTSPLAGLLIERALKNPNQIGFDLFWCLKVETYQPQHQERFGLLLNSYVDVCSLKIRAILRFQEELFAEGGRLDKICIEVRRLKATNVSEREVTAKLHNLLDQLNETLPSSFQLPIDPRIEVGKLIVAKCYVMNSAKSPLWLEFENAEAGQQSTAVIFKSGEDLRQEMLILQLLRVIDDMWREDGKNFALEPYRCVCTGPHTGVIQAVPRSVSSTEIQNRGHSTRGLLGAVTEDCYLVWIQEHNSSSRSQKTAMDLFMRSLAGYSVATYVLGLGNRQYDNIMMTHEGRVFLTDLSHFLGVYKYVPLLDMTLKRDPTPFVLTPQMSFVFGGEASPSFLKFIKLCGDAFNVVRQHLHHLVTLLVSMLPAELPELVDRESIQYIVETICPELDKTEAFLHFETLVRQIHSLKWNTASH